jgi:uncharacterized phosphosugar-binding protein
MDMVDRYERRVAEQLAKVFREQREAIRKASHALAECVKRGGLIYVFGCGHSHMLAEECFFRAGGLANVKPILIEPLMLHQGAAASSERERTNGYVLPFLEREPLQSEDVLIVVSTSGRNPAPIDAALWAKGRGAHTIGVTSFAYSAALASRHASGKHLRDCVDLAIDNYCDVGDAALTHPALPFAFAPTSTAIGAALLQAVFAGAVGLLAEDGFAPPVWISGNVDGADEHNRQLLERYKHRIPGLT